MIGDASVIRALLVTILAALFVALAPRVAHADDDVAKKGIAVVAAEGATDAAWPLARAIYGSAFLRPEKIDDEHARILAGDKRETQQPSIVELQELRAGVKGDDAASRQVLTAIAEKFGVASLLVVFVERDSAGAVEARKPPYAELFDVRTRAFDAARYAPDANGSWEGTLRSLERPFLPASTPIVAVSQCDRCGIERAAFTAEARREIQGVLRVAMVLGSCRRRRFDRRRHSHRDEHPNW